MKYLYSVLVLALVLAVVSMAPAQAGIIRGENLTIPGSGGGNVEDGDHPWGGDMIIGGAGSKTIPIVVYTGISVVDVVITAVIYGSGLETTTESTKVVQSATYNDAAVTSKSSPALTQTRHRYAVRKER